MTAGPEMFAVIADGHTGLDSHSAEIYSSREDAVQAVDDANRDAESAGVPLHHRVFTLTELDDTEMWDWGLRHSDGEVWPYVSEQAARNCAYDGVTLVRRRAGSDQWQPVDDPDGPR